MSLNTKKTKPKEYRRDFGPVNDAGFAVVCVVMSVRNENDETLAELLEDRVEGMRDDVALCNYEMAQRTESLCRVSDGFVSTHGDYPLTIAQASFAREIWELKLRQGIARSSAEAAQRERLQVVCDDVDEMPNMSHV